MDCAVILEGKRGVYSKKGSPGLRRMDGVELDWRNVGLIRWRTRALERMEWAAVQREAKTERTWL